MTTAIADGGLGFDDKTSGAIYGLYTMGVYLLALPGGWLADRLFGLKKSVWYGGIIIAMGHFMMALPGIFGSGAYEGKTELSALDTNSFFLGLILIVLGTGLLKPNISATVGALYKDNENLKDAGFTIFYMAINIGSILGFFICGYLGEEIGWHYGFGAAGIGMAVGLIQYQLTKKMLGDIGKDPESKVSIEMKNKLMKI